MTYKKAREGFAKVLADRLAVKGKSNELAKFFQQRVKEIGEGEGLRLPQSVSRLKK